MFPGHSDAFAARLLVTHRGPVREKSGVPNAVQLAIVKRTAGMELYAASTAQWSTKRTLLGVLDGSKKSTLLKSRQGRTSPIKSQEKRWKTKIKQATLLR